jgi:hypothetical protein
MAPVVVMIPGWGGETGAVGGAGGSALKKAYITSATIKRTHITSKRARGTGGKFRTARAIITVTLKEAVFFKSAEEAQGAGQASF